MFVRSLVGLLACFVASEAFGQDATLNAERFAPVRLSNGFATVDTARQLPSLTFGFDLYMDYAWRPLQLAVEGEDGLDREVGVIEHLGAAHLGLAVGLTRWLEIDVTAPAVVGMDSEAGFQDLGGEGQSFGIGDLGAQLRFQIVPEREAVGVSVAPFVNIPIGSKDIFLSDGVLGLGGRVSLSASPGPVHVALSGGYKYKLGGATLTDTVAMDDEVLYALGVGFDIVPEMLRFNLEGSGATVVGAARRTLEKQDYTLMLNSPIEANANFLYSSPKGWHVVVGGGPGITPAAGTPAVRAFVGFGYAPFSDGDKDKDGILDRNDDCPRDPEDIDRFEDEDGCPEVDNDKDGVLDVADQCPDGPEDFDSFQDEDGCPEDDNDRDGLWDVADQCPNDAEDVDGRNDQDGCPELDRDNDGLDDDIDACKDEPEDKDRFKDEDGCPDLDNDNDGLPDTRDLCPLDAEVVNGESDEDGCPDDVKAVLVADRIVILDKVLFYTDTAKIIPKSEPILDAVLKTLIDNPQVKKLRVEGHTDDRGPDKHNADLSQRRADAIREYLIAGGIAPERLEAKGYGEAVPVADNTTDAGREQNRRVEFMIIEQDAR